MMRLQVLGFAAAAYGATLSRRQLHPDFPSFDAFVQTYKRSYTTGTDEYKARRSVYEQRVAEAMEQNGRSDRLWTAGVNYLWDWSDEELHGLLGNRDIVPGSSAGGTVEASPHWTGFLEERKKAKSAQFPMSIPEEMDWRHLRSMKHVRSQGKCGSCWAVAATTLLEAHVESVTGLHRTFSAQQIVSCMPNPKKCGGEGGCRGASVELALKWVSKHGCAEENEIPYRANDSKLQEGECPSEAPTNTMFTTTSGAFAMQGWERLPENQEQPLVNALVQLGPVAVSVEGRHFWKYKMGIFDGCNRNAILSHAVVMIGFGVQRNGTKATKYWLLQNSWGQDWGEMGTIRMLRRDNEEEYCGVDDKPEYGSACQPYPDNITVCGTCGLLYSGLLPHFSKM